MKMGLFIFEKLVSESLIRKDIVQLIKGIMLQPMS